MSDEETMTRAERYFDGLMDAAETRAFEAELERSPELMDELTALHGTRDMLRGLVEDQVQAADFSGFFAEIQARLPQPAPAVLATPATPGQRFKSWWARYWTPVLVSAAAAAGVAFLVGRLGGPDPTNEEEDPFVVGGAVQVDEVNNDGPKTVLISMPVEDDEESATVIWLLDEEEDKNNGAGPAPTEEEDPI